MGSAIFFFLILTHISICISQNKILDITHNTIEKILDIPKETTNVFKRSARTVETLVLRKDPIFSNCFSVPNAFCVGGTTKVITATAIPEGLVGWWKFDEVYPIDHSGYGNNMHKAVRAGPAIFGHGASASFSHSFSASVTYSKSLKCEEFTVAFWFYLLEDSTGSFRNIFSKGFNNFQQTPTILMYPKTRRLSIRVTTHNMLQDGLSSIGTIPMRRWTHVAVTGSDKKLKIYINGIKDNEITLKSRIEPNIFGITIGALTFMNGFDGYIDDLRYYRRALKGSEIASITIPAITGIVDRDLISMGCFKCNYDTAILGNVCPHNYTLCSLKELFEGGLHIARVNGWIGRSTDIWHTEISSDDVVQGEKRMALCCKANVNNEISLNNQIEL